MPTYRVDVAYDGSGFRGYARQQGLRTVQGEIETAMATVLGTPVETSVAGRTDAGVHARGQVVSFMVEQPIDTDRFMRSVNGIVGPEIAFKAITGVEAGFNARFSAIWRRYRYLLDPNPASDPLTRNVTWHVGRPLNLGAMEEVAGVLVGEHDFSSFCRSVEGASNVRRVNEARWLTGEDGVYVFWIRANAFCHQMVRSIVGYSYDVGRGFSPAGEAAQVLDAKDRSAVVTVAPPHGLTLWEVGYR